MKVLITSSRSKKQSTEWKQNICVIIIFYYCHTYCASNNNKIIIIIIGLQVLP